MNKIIDTINNPQDVKKLAQEKLPILATEMRNAILQKVSDVGGHVGPNLAVVEMTIALHRVFNSPQDKIIWDVSHQSYPHKLLTGRKEGFLNPDKYQTITGYTTPRESEHDFFTVGHTSTSVSLATGLAQARNIKGGTENIIAVIGDGSLSGGEAFEGLNNGGRLNSNFIVVVNDNDMSIAKNEGSLYDNLALLRQTKGQAELNFFKTLGFEYLFVEAGNDIEALVSAFEEVKDTNKPVIVHVNTLKGKGYPLAEENKERFHYSGPFDLATGKPKNTGASTYTTVVADYLMKRAETDELLAVVNAAVPGGVGLVNFRETHPDKYYDTGIAEAQTIAFSSAMASQGIHAVAVFRSTFIQRAYDQIFQDLCIDKNPATIIVEGGTISSADVTHLGAFDIAMLSNIPNLIYLAPTNKQELEYMLDWAIEQAEYPVAIRTPENKIHEVEAAITPITELNHSLVTKQGNTVAILGLGGFYQLGESVLALLAEAGIDATLINPRFISGLDTTLLDELQQNHQLVVTLEDGQLAGGFGEKVASYYGKTAMKVLNFGAAKVFTDRTPLEQICDANHLTPTLIVEDIKASLK